MRNHERDASGPGRKQVGHWQNFQSKGRQEERVEPDGPGDQNHRGQGIARTMVQFALDHPDFTTVNWLLATADAHGVYAKLGFTQLTNPERWMSKGRFCTGA